MDAPYGLPQNALRNKNSVNYTKDATSYFEQIFEATTPRKRICTATNHLSQKEEYNKDDQNMMDPAGEARMD